MHISRSPWNDETAEAARQSARKDEVADKIQQSALNFQESCLRKKRDHNLESKQVGKAVVCLTGD